MTEPERRYFGPKEGCMDTNKNIVVFTGIPGTKVKACLQELKRQMPAWNVGSVECKFSIKY